MIAKEMCHHRLYRLSDGKVVQFLGEIFTVGEEGLDVTDAFSETETRFSVPRDEEVTEISTNSHDGYCPACRGSDMMAVPGSTRANRTHFCVCGWVGSRELSETSPQPNRPLHKVLQDCGDFRRQLIWLLQYVESHNRLNHLNAWLDERVPHTVSPEEVAEVFKEVKAKSDERR